MSTTIREAARVIPLPDGGHGAGAHDAGPHDALMGIVSRPSGDSNGAGVVILHGGGDHNLPSHRNRWTVDFARDLAADGFTVLRVGYRGVGESGGSVDVFRLDDPLRDDGMAMVDALLGEPGVERVYIVGSCFGARTALAVAPDCDAVSGVVLSSIPIANPEQRTAMDHGVADIMKRGFGKRGLGGLLMPGRRDRYIKVLKAKVRSLLGRRPGGATDPTPWVSASVVRGLRAILGRGGAVLFVYGGTDEFYGHFRDAAPGPLGVIAGSDRVTVNVCVDGRLHGYPSVEAQSRFVAVAGTWLRDREA